MASKKKGEGKAVTPKPTGKTEMQEEQQPQTEVTDIKADDSQLEIGANESTAEDTNISAESVGEQESADTSTGSEEQSEAASAPVVESQDAPAEENQEQGASETSATAPAPVEGDATASVDDAVVAATPAEPVVEETPVIIEKDPIEDEPKAALEPQPEVTPVAGDTDPVVDTPAVVEEQPVVLSTKAAILARLTGHGPAHLSGLRSMLVGYLDVMGSERRTTADEQLLQQKLFRTAVFSLLKLRGPEFISALDELLVVIAAHKDFVFKEKYVFREIKNLPVSAEERNALVNIITLLLTIAEPATRALALNQIDLGSALKGIRGEEEIRALIHEYVTRGL